jgi:hypothetical protein
MANAVVRCAEHMSSSGTLRLLLGSVVVPILLVCLDVAGATDRDSGLGFFFGLFVGGFNLAFGKLGFWSKPWVIVAYCTFGACALLFLNVYLSCAYRSCR